MLDVVCWRLGVKFVISFSHKHSCDVRALLLHETRVEMDLPQGYM